MREGTFNGGTIKYPDEIAFAFNSFVIELTNSNKGDVTIDITNVDNERTYSDKRVYYGGSFRVELSRYIQLLFDRPGYDSGGEKLSDTSINVQIDVKENSTIFTFNVVCVWGSIEPGEAFNEGKTVRWFKHFPQTVSMFIPVGAELQYKYDQASFQKYPEGKVGEVNHVVLGSLFPEDATLAMLKVTGDSVGSVWDYTFDYTFNVRISSETILNIKIDDCKEGIFLRWVDRFGFYQYWLFTMADKTLESSSDGEFITLNELVEARHYEYGRYQQRINERTIRIGASLLDSNEADTVVGIIQSPLVSIWRNNAWIPVSVSDGSVKLTSEHLQDIEITVNLPDLKTQKL